MENVQKLCGTFSFDDLINQRSQRTRVRVSASFSLGTVTNCNSHFLFLRAIPQHSTITFPEQISCSANTEKQDFYTSFNLKSNLLKLYLCRSERLSVTHWLIINQFPMFFLSNNRSVCHLKQSKICLTRQLEERKPSKLSVFCYN